MKPLLASRLTAVVVVLLGVGLAGPSMIAEGRHPIGGGPKPTSIVVLPPGQDALADAIRRAGGGGLVLLRAGVHSESGTVTITQPVILAGEPGAILESATIPATTYPLAVHAALHVRGASNVRIAGLTIRPPSDTTGGAAVLIESSPDVAVAANTITGHQFGVIVQGGDRAIVSGNTIEVDAGWATGAFPEAHGIVVINGRATLVDGNHVSSALFGIWACDQDGTATNNTGTGSFIGLILCKVPEGNFLISGSTSGSTLPATNWDARANLMFGNEWGYIVIDGANNNRLSHNDAHSNAVYDLELTGDTYRFGFLTPMAYENSVSTGGTRDLVIKDCGRDNKITGSATLVDTTADPCF